MTILKYGLACLGFVVINTEVSRIVIFLVNQPSDLAIFVGMALIVALVALDTWLVARLTK